MYMSNRVQDIIDFQDILSFCQRRPAELIKSTPATQQIYFYQRISFYQYKLCTYALNNM